MIVYRVECLRPGKEHSPGLVGDYADVEAAREAAQECKAAQGCRVTITTGTDDGLNERGHAFQSQGQVEEV